MGDVSLAAELRNKGITDERTLAAIASLSRSDFLPDVSAGSPVGDHPLPIGHGQTISQPYIVAYMTQALSLKPGDKVLEVGTGSGYQAAVLARMGVEVYSVEIVPQLAAHARSVISQLGLPNVHLREGDGWNGWPEAAPFDGIILTAAPELLPSALLYQLAVGGRMVAPIGMQDDAQLLVRVRRTPEGLESERLLPVRFVPMTGGSARDYLV